MAFVPIVPKQNPEVTYYRIKCMTCPAVVAIMDYRELVPFLVYLQREQEPVLCFECEDNWEEHKKAHRILNPLLV